MTGETKNSKNVLYRIRYTDPLLTTYYKTEKELPVDEVWRDALEWGSRHGYGAPVEITKQVGGKTKRVRKK